MAVVIAGLGSSSGAGLPLSITDTKGAARAVFVDRAELARLHPSWRDLSDMRTVLAGARKSAPSAGSASSMGSTGRSRSALAARAAVEASAALDGLESRKLAALTTRREAMKVQMMKSSEAEWKAEARSIEEASAIQTKTIDNRHSADLVNARLRVSAARVMGKVSKLDGSGMDKDAAGRDVRDANASLDSVSGASDAEKSRVMAEANAKIDALKQAAEKQIDERLGAYQLEQSRRIADSMASARMEMARELGPSSTPVLFAATEVSSLTSLESTVAALQARIDKDVDLVVRELARDRGLKVTFERRGSRTPDVTAVFVGLIKKHGWNSVGPAVSGLGSS